MDAKQTLMLRQIKADSPSKLKIFERIYTTRPSASLCLKAKCLECCWHDHAAIRECTATECPLHSRRPYTSSPRNPSPDTRNPSHRAGLASLNQSTDSSPLDAKGASSSDLD